MAEQSFPFENIDTTEAQFSEWATNFQETGVQGSPTGTELGITVTGSDLNLTIAAGQAFIRGHYYINTDDLVLAVTSAGTNTRIDIVVVELDPEANTIVTKIVSGEAVSADPVAPTLTQSATGIYQLPIATLTIPTSTVVITAGMLVDTRTFMGNRVGIWTTATRPANPTAYQTLGYNTTIESHESWNGTGWVGFFDPISTEGDLVVGDGTGQASRLGVGANDQVLTVVAGAPAWADGGGGGNYYNITAGGTYTVDLAAGLYGYSSTGVVTVGGVSLNGVGLTNYDSSITQIVASGGITWTTRTSGFGSTIINGVTYGDGLYVAVGSSGVLTTSPDGITWTTRTSGFGTDASTVIYGVIYGDGLYVAVGRIYDGDSTSGLTTSPDGITWTTRTSGFGSTLIRGVTYGDGVYVAGGEAGKLTTSTDGITWTTRTSGFGTSTIYGVGYGDGLYVAVGSSGKLTTSTDGTTWTTRTSGFGSTIIRGVTFGNGVYVAVGHSGTMTTSTDGITWTTRTSGFGTAAIIGVTYGAGLYVAVGSSGTMTTSTDGITWTVRTSGFGSTSINGVTYGDGLYVAVGESGTLTTSPFEAIYLSLELKSPVTTLS
jgi:hypothetical protein